MDGTSVASRRIPVLCAHIQNRPLREERPVSHQCNVTIPHGGRVRGRFECSDSGADVAVFRGIPYAAPPTGERRFRRPMAAQPWHPQVLECTQFRAASLQAPRSDGLAPADLASDGSTSEDCLFLNVWTPELPREVPGPCTRPVVVWVHGGAFVSGMTADPLYNGANLATTGEGCVFVSVNYRLGALGWLHVDGGDANCGLWDLVAALQWVQSNISVFGGDNTNVTVAGESAGGQIALMLTASPVANRLFHRVVGMSCMMHNIADSEVGRMLGQQFAQAAVGMSFDRTPAPLEGQSRKTRVEMETDGAPPLVHALQQLSAADILATQQGLRDLSPPGAPRHPKWLAPGLALGWCVAHRWTMNFADMDVVEVPEFYSEVVRQLDEGGYSSFSAQRVPLRQCYSQ
eukprot:m.735482 g.735482  ORF g.735482 m.735482 type:complete len:403 (-) comp23090_c1_seq7:44-1252(-)